MKGSVRKRGEKWSYYFDIGKDETGKRKKVERSGFKTKKECELALRKAMDEYDNEGTVFKEQAWTVNMACDYWYETTMNNVKYNTNRIRKSIIKNRIIPYIGHIYLSKLTPLVLQNYFNEVANRGYTNGYINDIYTVLNQSFTLAVKNGYMKMNIMTKIIKPSKPDELHAPIEALTDEEILNLLSYIQKHNRDYYLPVLFGLHMGTRIGETFALTWDALDLENKKVSINKQLIHTRKSHSGSSEYKIATPKTKAGTRVTYLTHTLVEALQEFKEQQAHNKKRYEEHYITNDLDYVFVRENGELIKYDSLQTFLRRAGERLGFRTNYHRLRHTHITKLFEVGATIKEVQTRVGQSDLRTTLNIYTHVTEQMTNKTATAFDATIVKLPPIKN
ncbi:site-specific integrase [Turicibacter sanguinis]|uniref:site-specific integrase n=1 Tax=Turicibacter sanguinis TaxID=154288 RepID=UPI0018AB7393|nr:site-specific integrase [Turicibacter sanguinis]MDB8564282.1 site-specific integrase [Turicibacter sanguinis]